MLEIIRLLLKRESLNTNLQESFYKQPEQIAVKA